MKALKKAVMMMDGTTAIEEREASRFFSGCGEGRRQMQMQAQRIRHICPRVRHSHTRSASRAGALTFLSTRF